MQKEDTHPYQTIFMKRNEKKAFDDNELRKLLYILP
jgi:hypothetical protein